MGIIAGAMAGAGEAGVQAGLQYQRHAGEMDLQKAREEAAMARETTLQLMRQEHDKSMVDVRANSELKVNQGKIDQETDPANVDKKATAAITLSRLTLPAEVERKTQLAAVDTQQKVEEFTKLQPFKRQEAIDTEVAKLKALSTPEALSAARKIAMSTHIVDPSYVAVPQADGTVVMVNSRNPKDTNQLMIGGSPVVQKNSEALQAATAVLNYVAREGATLRAEHQTALTNAMGDATAIKNANDAYKVSKGILESQATAALAGLQGKAGAKTDKPGESAAPAAGPRRPLDAFDAGAPKTSTPKAGAPASAAPQQGGTFSGELDMTAPAGGIIAGKLPPRAPVIAPAPTTESIAKDQGRDLNKWR